MNTQANMTTRYEREIPEGYEARIEGNKVIIELKESEDERIRKELIEQVGYIIPDKDECDDEGRVLPIYHKRIGRYRAYLEKQKHSLTFDAISSWLRGHANNYVNGEFNEFHHCVEYDGTIDTEKLIADLKAAVDGE